MAGDKLFNVAIARVVSCKTSDTCGLDLLTDEGNKQPFVDCINTLLDKDLPLTVIGINIQFHISL